MNQKILGTRRPTVRFAPGIRKLPAASRPPHWTGDSLLKASTTRRSKFSRASRSSVRRASPITTTGGLGQSCSRPYTQSRFFHARIPPHCRAGPLAGGRPPVAPPRTQIALKKTNPRQSLGFSAHQA